VGHYTSAYIDQESGCGPDPDSRHAAQDRIKRAPPEFQDYDRLLRECLDDLGGPLENCFDDAGDVRSGIIFVGLVLVVATKYSFQ